MVRGISVVVGSLSLLLQDEECLVILCASGTGSTLGMMARGSGLLGLGLGLDFAGWG